MLFSKVLHLGKSHRKNIIAWVFWQLLQNTTTSLKHANIYVLRFFKQDVKIPIIKSVIYPGVFNTRC